jgi:hypothetical protein
MKQLFKTPMLSLIVLVLASGSGIFWEWRNWRVFLLLPPFLFFLSYFVFLLRQRLRKAVDVNQAKAGHVS